MKVSAQSARPFLSLQEATFRLGERLIFPKTSWVFQQQEHWAMVGPNGSGKSLLADALRGSLPLVQGDLCYHFHPCQGLSPEETIGHVSFEERKLDLHDTVVQSRWNSLEEESALAARDFLAYERVMDINPFEVTRAQDSARSQFQRRQRRAIALLQIGPLLDRRLISLSNGERQRLQLARALCRPLRLLILDEPFVGLDAAARERFQALLERLMSTSLRVLLITTRPEDLPRRVTHLLRVDKCRVIAAGPRAQIIPTLRAGPRSQQMGTGRTRLSSNHAEAKRLASARPNLKVAPAGAAPLVELRNVAVRYGTTTILSDLTWCVRPGESWALLGPNGSGKTTLLSLIQGDHPQAYANHVVVFG
ncbi:MAG TPA: ATP-binding cassette domain-containing protein, partial [Candidatus Sulfotelmatobacter sp.]|nr:ATP-binding cassette domain-containing protein [Candidatus Sulfotelmatobacter sp.]